jgi:hypothetical protein
MDQDGPEHLTGTEARAGTTPHMARVALFGGLGLVILIFAIILLVGGR